MTHYCSEFCQDPPESSGRWECPDIRRSVHVNSRYQQTTADAPPCATLAAYLSKLFSPVPTEAPTTPWLIAAPSLAPTRKIPRRRIEGGEFF